MKRFNVVIFAECDESGVAAGSVIEGKDQGTGKIGSVESAGSVTEMMIETGKAATGKKLAKVGQRGFAIRIFAAGPFGHRAAVSESNCADIGEAKAGRSEHAGERKMRKGLRVVGAADFFFLDGGEDIVAIEEGDGCAGTWSGDAENVHC